MLDFDGEEQLGGAQTWRFRDPNDGAIFRTQDPALAMDLGAPPPGASPPAVPAPVAAATAPVSPGWTEQAAPPPGARVMTLDPVQAAGARTISQTQKDELNRRVAANNAPPATAPSVPAAPASGLTAETLAAEPQPVTVANEQAQPTSQLPEYDPVVMTPEFMQRRVTKVAPREATWNPDKMAVSGINPDASAQIAERQNELYRTQQSIAVERAKQQEQELRTSVKQGEYNAMMEETRLAALRADVAEKERIKRKESAKLDAEAAEIAKRAPSVRDYWARKGGGGVAAVAALFAGLGAVGASLTRGPNYALEILNRDMDTDLDLQAAQIAADKDAIKEKKNALAARMADGEDPRYAREALKAAMIAKTKSDLERMETRKMLESHGINVAEALAGLDGKYLQQRIELEKLTNTKVESKFQAARAGGTVLEPMDAYLKRVSAGLDIEKKFNEVTGANPTQGMREAEFKAGVERKATGANAPLEERTKGFADDMQKGEYAKALGIVNGTLSAIENVKKESGGKITGVGGLYNLVSEGGALEAIVLSDAEKSLRAELKNLQDALVLRQRTGAGASESEQRLYKYLVEGNETVFGSPEDVERAVRMMGRDTDREVRNLAVKWGSPASPNDAYDNYMRRYQQTNVGTETGRPVSFTPDED